MSAVRVAGADDAAVLARLLHDFNTEFETEVDPVDVLEERFGRILLDDAVLAVLAEDDAAAPTGFALVTLRPAIWFDGPVAALEELYVVPPLRDRGIGSALISLVREQLVERGCPEMHIGVDEVDVDTRRFYERHGFVNVEPGTDYRMLYFTGPTSPAGPIERGA